VFLWFGSFGGLPSVDLFRLVLDSGDVQGPDEAWKGGIEGEGY
jgi:hypothetical protein